MKFFKQIVVSTAITSICILLSACISLTPPYSVGKAYKGHKVEIGKAAYICYWDSTNIARIVSIDGVPWNEVDNGWHPILEIQPGQHSFVMNVSYENVGHLYYWKDLKVMFVAEPAHFYLPDVTIKNASQYGARCEVGIKDVTNDPEWSNFRNKISSYLQEHDR